MERELEKIEALIQKRDIKKAEVAIAKMLRNPLRTAEQAQLLQQRARLRLIAGRVEDAILDLKDLKTLDAELFESAGVLALLADCHLARFETATIGFADKQDIRLAINLYQNLIKDYPESENLGWLYYQNGRALLIEDHAAAAESAFHEALFAPSIVPALTAYCYERLGFIAFYESRQVKQALTYLDKALDTYPKTENPLWLVQIYLLKSRVLKEQNTDEAIKAAKKALQMAGDNRAFVADAAFAVAELLSRQLGNEQEIIDYLQRFMQNAKSPIGVDVTWSRVYEMLGDAYQETEQYDAAVMAYHNALHTNPYHPWEESLHYRIARVYYQQQSFGLVIESLQNSLETGKAAEDYRVFNLLANAAFALGRYADAARYYEQALGLAPHGTDVQAIQAYYQLALNPPL